MPRRAPRQPLSPPPPPGLPQAYLMPAPGLIILDPARPREPLPAEGRKVPLDSYWLRRLADGDVVARDEKASDA